jgi:hypothetical protein
LAGQNTLIVASDYNAIQAKIALVLGTGSDDYGYGQLVASSQVSQNTPVTVTQWNNLRNDLLRARQHQTISEVSLTQASTTIRITEADRAAYNNTANLCTADRLIAPPVGQATRENLVATQTRIANWNGTLSQTVTVNFPSADAARYYFNTGSRFEFSSNRIGGAGHVGDGSYSGTLKDRSWSTLLTNMGTIYFTRNATSATGTGTGSAIGYANLTTSNQQVFEKTLTGDTYYPNKFVVLARAPSTSQLVFTLQWRDDSLGAPDEDVAGTLTSIVQAYRASGTNVSIPLPPATTTGL